MGFNAQELAEQQQQLKTIEEQPRRVSAEEINRELVEIRRLRRLAKDLDRQMDRQEGSAVQIGDPGSEFCLARRVGEATDRRNF